MDDIERRLIVLEKASERLSLDVKDMLAEVKAMRADLAELKGRVNSLPTTLQLLLFAVAVFTAAGVVRVFGH